MFFGITQRLIYTESRQGCDVLVHWSALHWCSAKLAVCGAVQSCLSAIYTGRAKQ